MYQHKLCSATYLPLDPGLHQATKMHEQPRSNLPPTRPSFKTRSPSLKLSDFLRQAHPSRSASIMSKKSQKAGSGGIERPSTSQGPPSPSSRFPSVRRMQRGRPQLLPAFQSTSDDKPVTVKVEKPLPSEPPFDFEKFFRRPGTSTSPRTRAKRSEAQPLRSDASIHNFVGDCPKSQTTPIRYSFILQTDTLNDEKRGRHSRIAGLPCGETYTSSPYENPPASTNLIVEGRTGYCPDSNAYRLGTPSLSPAFAPWPTSPCERLSKSRKRQAIQGKAPRPTISRSETDPVPTSAPCQSWMDDDCTSSVIGSSTATNIAGNARSGTQVRRIRSRRGGTDNTQLSLDAVVAVNPGRPKLVSVSRTCSTATSLPRVIKPSTPQQNPKLVSAFSPDTPPDTPDAIDNGENLQDVLATMGITQKKLETAVNEAPRPITPPRTPSVTTSGTLSRSRGPLSSGIVPDDVVPKSYRSFSIRAKQLPWILSQLEESVANFPLTMLQPNSLVIFELRKQRAPRLACQGTPQMSPSSSRPRSSHFRSRHSRSSSLRSSPQPHQPEYYHQSGDLEDSQLQPLRNIFPCTTDAFRCSLFATLLALNHVSELLISAFPPTSRQSPFKVPEKARARLGIRLPFLTSSSLERSQVRFRIERLLEGLQMCARRMIETMGGPALGNGDEALLKAVGEVVRTIG